MKGKLLACFVILTLLASELAIFHFVPSVKANPDWLSGWTYRKSHIVYHATGAGTNYQVRVTTTYQSNPDDAANAAV